MDRWVWYALASMAFAGATAVVAKIGLATVSADLGSAVRTAFVFLFMLAFAAVVVPNDEYAKLGRRDVLFLALSAALTAASWVCYYRAVQQGPVAGVTLIDKGSLVVAVLLAWLLLGEEPTPQLLVGCGLVVAGLVVASRS
ncbi:EamA family transporter [Urbifossiella limnaea]|uniref:EamA-like transporter family protein n=1 Tax=Urbifossiella limnaea TaxID=2528023 RepID=A0A517XXD6_9BACT|nr:EamA family transporter [Urbifossiella limnaea]QDU22176.1 EamA-like transporter family protein [Urbifossiella limnaea]